MKTIEFILPVANEHSVVVQEDIVPYGHNTLHRHKETQITLIVKGVGAFFLENTTNTFTAGDIYIVGSNQAHCFKSDLYHVIHIFFDHRKILSALQNLPEFQPIAKFLDFSQKGIKIPAAHAGAIWDKIWLIKDNSNFERFLHLLLLLQFFSVNRIEWEILFGGSSAFPVDQSGKLRMHEVYQYTLDHFSEDISLTQVASVACLTTQAFCKYFKRHTRKTYVTFLNEIRINEACKKILSNDYDNISSIAYATGFNSAITFNRVFKKITGKCPTEYIHRYKFEVK